MRILLVEDDELLGAGIRDALDRAQLGTEWVTGGREVAAALRATSFDLETASRFAAPRVDGRPPALAGHIDALKKVESFARHVGENSVAQA